jgi:hypothetical protein
MRSCGKHEATGMLRLQEERLPHGMAIFEMIRHSRGTALPGKAQEIPDVDRGVEIDQGGDTLLFALGSLHGYGLCLTKLLKFYNGFRHLGRVGLDLTRQRRLTLIRRPARLPPEHAETEHAKAGQQNGP